MKSGSLENIPVAAIDEQDTTFAISSKKDIEALVISIGKIGLVNPLHLQKTKENRFRVVIGFRRLAAVKELGIETIPAFITSNGSKDRALFEQALLDNLSIRRFNSVELSVIIYKLENLFNVSKQEIIQKYFPLLGYGRNPKVYDLYVPLIRLDEAWQKAIIQDLVSIDIAVLMTHESEETRNAFLSIIHELRLGKNQQREFWALLSDVCRMQEIDLAKLLQKNVFATILQEEKLTATQKAERFKHELYKLRYPNYTATLQRFDALLKEAKLPPALSLRHPPFFEGEQFTVIFSFKNEKEFEDKVAALQKMQSDGIIKQLFDLC